MKDLRPSPGTSENINIGSNGGSAFDLDWKGVRISKAERTIWLDERKYSCDDILGCECTTTVEKSCFGTRVVGGIVKFSIKDAKYPIHKVNVRTILGNIDENYSRITMLLGLK